MNPFIMLFFSIGPEFCSFFIFPFLLFLVQILSFGEFLLFTLFSILYYIYYSFPKIEKPPIIDEDLVNIVIAPSEAASRSAFTYIVSSCKLSSFHCDYIYTTVGTQALTKSHKDVKRIHPIFDSTDYQIHDVPNLSKLITYCIIFIHLTCFIICHKKNVKNIISYSNHDIMIPFFYIWKFFAKNIRIISFGFPEREANQKKPALQTKCLLSVADRIILPTYGNIFEEYYKKIISQKSWQKSNQIIKCFSAFVLDLIQSSKECQAISFESRSEIAILLGFSLEETKKHLTIGCKIIKSILSTKGAEHTITLLYTDSGSKKVLEALRFDSKISVAKENDHNYKNTRLCICAKNSLLLIRPVLFGCPVIPFYELDFRSKIAFFVNSFFTAPPTNLYKLTPNIITNSPIITEEFINRIDKKKLIATILDNIENPNNLIYEHRQKLVCNYLATNPAQSYTEIINNFFLEQKNSFRQLQKILLNECHTDKCEVAKRSTDHIRHKSLIELFVYYTSLTEKPVNNFIEKFPDANYKPRDNETIMVLAYQSLPEN